MGIIELEPEFTSFLPEDNPKLLKNFTDSDKHCICVAKKINTIVARSTHCVEAQPFICQKMEGTEIVTS